MALLVLVFLILLVLVLLIFLVPRSCRKRQLLKDKKRDGKTAYPIA